MDKILCMVVSLLTSLITTIKKKKIKQPLQTSLQRLDSLLAVAAPFPFIPRATFYERPPAFPSVASVALGLALRFLSALSAASLLSPFSLPRIHTFWSARNRQQGRPPPPAAYKEHGIHFNIHWRSACASFIFRLRRPHTTRLAFSESRVVGDQGAGGGGG